VKHGSIEIKKGTLENKFILSDFKNDIAIVYKGAMPPAFREGDMCTVGGYLADHKVPNLFIGTSVGANHDIDTDRWIGDINIDNKSSLNMIEPDPE
jgi:cytochrome c-type biogenesis protein CcmE